MSMTRRRTKVEKKEGPNKKKVGVICQEERKIHLGRGLGGPKGSGSLGAERGEAEKQKEEIGES